MIEGQSIKGKSYRLRIWEDDTTGKNDLLYNREHKFNSDKQIVYIDLTEDMQRIGEIGNDKKNPDSGEYWTGNYQEIFAEVIFLSRTAQSQTINVDLKTEAKKQENARSPSMVKEEKAEKKEETKKEDGSISTFDGKYTAKKGEVYINVIAPTTRDLQGPLIVFDDKKILFKTHSLCRGSNSNRLKAAGNGDTPTGRATTSYNAKRHNGKWSYGNYGLIYLEGESGEFLQATKNGRAGIAIHSGHTTGYSRKSLKDLGKLMSTYGCIRVYNEEMKKLGELYTGLKKLGKKNILLYRRL